MRRYGTYIAWVLATFASLLSLYLSEIEMHIPCHLCWYQRICLFPLAIILGIASWRGFYGIVIYVIPQVVIGLLLALYQVAIQEIPGWNPIDMCGTGPSCSEKIAFIGPITVPMSSAACFFALAILLFLVLASKKPTEGKTQCYSGIS